ncbi:cbb3-type cytochrome oxidase assembly protein CcoS [Candidatus Karelsulcia muelleri]
MILTSIIISMIFLIIFIIIANNNQFYDYESSSIRMLIEN